MNLSDVGSETALHLLYGELLVSICYKHAAHHTSEGREEATLVLLLFVFVLPKKRKRPDGQKVERTKKEEQMTN